MQFTRRWPWRSPKLRSDAPRDPAIRCVVLTGAGKLFCAGGDIGAYTAIGLTPDGGMSWLLPRIAGMKRAQAMILTNRRVSAGEALAIGMVTRLVPGSELAATGRQTASELAAAATGALGAARGLLLAGAETGLDAHLDCEARAIAAAAASTECHEGPRAFLA